MKFNGIRFLSTQLGLFVGLVMLALNSKAQDPQFSHLFATGVYNNPAFTGLAKEARFAFDTRVQWSNLPGAFSTQYAVGDYYNEDWKSGFGLMILSDKSGGSLLNNTSVNALYAYEIGLNENWTARGGLRVGYVISKLDVNQLVFGDQQDGGISQQTFDGNYSNSHVDVAAGGLIYSDALWFSLGAHHLNKPNLSLIGTTVSKLPVRLSISGGAKVVLRDTYGPIQNGIDLLPVFHLRSQGNDKQLDIGTYVEYSALMLGVLYRGVPVSRFGFKQNDALALLLGFKLEKITLNYSYDYSLSALKVAGGSHEVSLVYEFGVMKRWSPENRERSFVF